MYGMSFYFILTTGVPQRSYVYISMKQPLMIYRDTGFFEMCPKFFLLKMKFKVQILATCVYMSVRYINNFWRVVGLAKFLIKSRVIFFVLIQAKDLRQTRFLDLLPRSFRGKSNIFKKKILILRILMIKDLLYFLNFREIKINQAVVLPQKIVKLSPVIECHVEAVGTDKFNVIVPERTYR